MAERRKSPFSLFEKELLTELALPYLGIIECKRTDAVYNQQKNEAWQKITDKFNASRSVIEKVTPQKLKKLWLNMKTRARDVKTAEKQRMHTGGGPYVPDPPPENDLLTSVLADVNIMPSIKIYKDSDGVGDEDGDNDEDMWRAKKNRIQISDDQGVGDEYGHNDEDMLRAKKKSIQIPDDQESVVVVQIIEEKETRETETTSKGSLEQKETSGNNNNKTKNHKSVCPPIDILKKKLVEKDVEQRKVMFELNYGAKKQTESINIEIKTLELEIKKLEYDNKKLEYDHKKRIYQMIEYEQMLKIKKAKKDLQLQDSDDEN